MHDVGPICVQNCLGRRSGKDFSMYIIDIDLIAVTEKIG
jgi:hypothetical protein